MAGGFSKSSAQASVEVMFTSTQAAGTSISVCDAAGKTLVSYESAKQFQHIVISSPELIQGETYTLVRDGQTLCSFTQDSTVMCVDENGSASAGGGRMEGRMPGGHTGGGFKPGRP